MCVCVCVCVCVYVYVIMKKSIKEKGRQSFLKNKVNSITSRNHVPKCMSCHKPIVMITGRAHSFYDYMFIMSILLL